MIQYAPIIANTVPAFINNSVKIYFTHNEAVSNSISTMYLMIKDLEGNIQNGSDPISADSFNLDQGYAIFPLGYNDGTEIKYMAEKGQYYKFQIAYGDSDGTKNLAYSSVAIGKCVSNITPTVTITTLSDKKTLKGTLSNNSDLISVSENIYSYQFIVKTEDKNTIIEDSGERLCPPGTANIVQYTCFNELDGKYAIGLNITTINGYEIKEETILTIKQPTEKPTGGFQIQVTNDYSKYDNGYVNIKIYNTTAITISSPIEYIVERYTENEGYRPIASYTQDSSVSKKEELVIKLNDFSIQHGTPYKYSIRTFSSARVISEEIIPYFEDTFLTDKNRQLKICFNPKVSSFKDTILEQKTDTIGGQYPFIFRNGQVRYKEIPISGLISYLADEEQRFVSKDDLGVTDCVTNLTDENIAVERKFKLEVLNWLTNGEPKLFRSPTEGNYNIRLMNVSLSPNDTLGRMIHTFSATGYEIDDTDQIIVEWQNKTKHRLGVD